MYKLLLIVSTLFVIGCQQPKEDKQTTLSPFNEVSNLIDQYAESTLARGNINSLAVAAYRDGETYHNYYGELDTSMANTPNDSTVYEIASITKIFAGSLTARAVLEKKLSLDDDIRKYIGMDYTNLEFEGTPITIKDLVTHTLGLKEKTPPKLAAVIDEISEGYYETRPIEYNMSNLLQELKTVEVSHKPGTYYNYNSVGPELVAYILTQVYNKPYKKLLMDFLKTLEMNNTFLLDNSQKSIENLANGYDEYGELAPKDKNTLTGGAFGLLSTLPDLIKLMKFQLESDDPLIKEVTRVLYDDEDDNRMGYLWDGFGIGEKEGFYYSKSGTSGGVQSIVFICPDSNYGQIVIMNNTSEAAFDDWGWLFDKMENDLIEYPKINLISTLKPLFISDISEAKNQYQKLKNQKSYFNDSWSLSKLGYEFLYVEKDVDKAIEIFKFSITENPENPELFYGLGEAYYVKEDYKNAAIYYKKHLALNPDSEKAKKYILKSEAFLN